MSDRLTYWQRRARDAEHRIKFAEEHAEHTRRWALEAFAEQRRLGDRCTFLYGKAIEHGATHEELRPT